MSGPNLLTPRLQLREFTVADAPFILRLVNEPAWLAHIGDRGVHTVGDAERYLRTGPMAMYRREGFGLWCVALQETGAPIGMCGVLRRASLEAPDLGFAMLAAHRRQGYTLEAAQATVSYAQRVLGLSELLAITSPTNEASKALLRRLGFRALREETDVHVFQLALDDGATP